MPEKMWMVRAGEGGYIFDDFITHNLVAIGWDELGDLSGIKTPEQVKELVKKTYPNYAQGKLYMTAGQINRFRFELTKNSYVITYNPETRIYRIGVIVGDYEYDTQRESYKHIHKVEWKSEVSRDSLSVMAKNYLGAIMTLFEITAETYKEIISVAEGKKLAPEATREDIEKVEIADLKESVVEQSKEFIKDRLSKLDGYQMQDLVAGILRAMGYKTFVSQKGADRGKDIVASPYGLGFEEPKIAVQVKHRKDQVGREEITSFIGSLRKEKGLYVSTGGFTKEARYEAERATTPITIVDFDFLVRLIIDNYDKFDSEAKDLIPLTKIYWLE
jgi:restriction system protein